MFCDVYRISRDSVYPALSYGKHERMFFTNRPCTVSFGTEQYQSTKCLKFSLKLTTPIISRRGLRHTQMVYGISYSSYKISKERKYYSEG